MADEIERGDTGDGLLDLVEQRDRLDPSFNDKHVHCPHPTKASEWVTLGVLKTLLTDPMQRMMYLRANPWVTL